MILPAVLAIAAGCLAIDAPQDRITAGDLARALPEWSAIAPDSALVPAPLPGVIRVLRIAELRRLASCFSVASNPSADLCVQVPVAPVPAGRMLPAMRASLPGAHIEIVEPSRVPAPTGEPQFPLGGLRPGYWFGYIPYGAGHKFVVWARVNIGIPVKRLVASVDLKPGQAIVPGQLRIEVRDEFPTAEARAADPPAPDELAGWVPRRAVAARGVVQKQWLDPPKLVQRGDVVKVEVVKGGARLEIEGIAETPGALGDMISVLNPDSKRRFQARVESRGRVSVKAGL